MQEHRMAVLQAPCITEQLLFEQECKNVTINSDTECDSCCRVID